MGIEYKIKFTVPDDFKSPALFEKLPSPISRDRMVEIYNYSVESDGFYFIDHLVNQEIASLALRRFIDEALRHGPSVEVIEL
jgi:hypothetical protein